MIRIPTAAKMIGVTRQTLYKHIKQGNLQTFEIDGVRFVNRDDVLALDAKNREMRERRYPFKKGESV